MNWFIGFLLVLSLAVNVLLALVLADIRAEQKLKEEQRAAADNEDLDRELLRIVNGRYMMKTERRNDGLRILRIVHEPQERG